ncbi:MAG TPA: diaminobutyrate--2-oxoglutarate transaminase [Candidatus Acidoferrum sp.]|nr:diaminobutyrate--2-oxoglutarate transaminase [Candidatus Acidoferrum sp.]
MNHEQVFEALESNVRSYCRETPNLFSRAKGASVWDNEGKEFIDFLSGCGSLNYGHNHPVLKGALIDYLANDGIGNALDFHTEAKLKFMSRFEEVLLGPRHLPHRMQFTGPTGANCVEAALKLARKFTGRFAVASFTNAFHGMSTGALSVTGSRLARESMAPLLQGITRLPYDGYCGAGLEVLDRFYEMAMDPSGGIDPLAAIIVETVQGEGGLNVASVGWLRKLREISSSLGALLIFDDIQAGCGRTGNFFSFDHSGVVPDLICLSKSLSGYGLPMSMLLISPEFDVWRPAEHNGTFRGNSFAFVTAEATLQFWEDKSFVDSIAVRSKLLDTWTRDVLLNYPGIAVRRKGVGMMAGVEFRTAAHAQGVASLARQSGILIERCGPRGEILKVFAPINIDCALFDEGLRRLTAAIEKPAEMGSPGQRPVAA